MFYVEPRTSDSKGDALTPGSCHHLVYKLVRFLIRIAQIC